MDAVTQVALTSVDADFKTNGRGMYSDLAVFDIMLCVEATQANQSDKPGVWDRYVHRTGASVKTLLTRCLNHTDREASVGRTEFMAALLALAAMATGKAEKPQGWNADTVVEQAVPVAEGGCADPDAALGSLQINNRRLWRMLLNDASLQRAIADGQQFQVLPGLIRFYLSIEDGSAQVESDLSVLVDVFNITWAGMDWTGHLYMLPSRFA